MLHAARIRKLYLYRAGISKAEIARRLKLPRTSVRRVPCHGFFPEVGRPTPYARLPKAHKLRRLWALQFACTVAASLGTFLDSASHI